MNKPSFIYFYLLLVHSIFSILHIIFGVSFIRFHRQNRHVKLYSLQYGGILLIIGHTILRINSIFFLNILFFFPIEAYFDVVGFYNFYLYLGLILNIIALLPILLDYIVLRKLSLIIFSVLYLVFLIISFFDTIFVVIN